MANLHLYYHLKPYMPWRLRMAFRRLLAQSRRRTFENVWPINEAAGQTPAGWPGWPDGKKFAVVLTHDVEGLSGLGKCRQLMQLEQKLGFRSSFNFIPEGDYRVSREFRDELAQNGFEVGVHDLHHDGKLYRTRDEFAKKAALINRYLKDWGVSGFRSGFMHHRLDWLHDLNIKYDASTFDTDPFEPQPDSVGTIFPFWVAGPHGKGYIELPYTLPQDSTLFLILKERGLDIWKRKLAWIAQKGGMALLDIHPDYMSFNGRVASSEYPVGRYEEFLRHIAEEYRGAFWNATPNEVADWYKELPLAGKSSLQIELNSPAETPALNGAAKNHAPALNGRIQHSSRKRICMITHSVYESDNRVIRYARALADRGDEVDIVALKRDASQPDFVEMDGVRVHRVQVRANKDHHNKGAYLLPILKFWLKSCKWLSLNHLKKSYDVVHVHNVPDFLVFAAWLPRLSGAKVILDIHDMVPEFYASKFKSKNDSLGVRLLKKVEHASAAFAHHVIISNHLWHDVYTARSAHQGKCSVFVNRVDSSVFHRREKTRNDGKVIIMFPGGLQWHQGLDIAIKAVDQLARKIPQAEFHVYGDGNMKHELLELTQSLGLANRVRFFDPLPASKIAQVMSTADLGVVPKRADSFGNEAYSTKITEFMSLGVPVVVSKTKIDQFYFNDSVVRFFESGNPTALAEAMYEVLRNDDLRGRMVRNADEYVVKNSWDVRKNDYLQLVDSLDSTKF